MNEEYTNEINNSETGRKKITKLSILGFAVLLSFVIGATYAYFSVTAVSNFGTSTINAAAGPIGTVTLNGSGANLNMSLTALDMVQGNNPVTYYASPSGKTTTPTTVTLGTASLSPNTDTNNYHCTVTLSVTHTGTNDMYNKFNHKTGNVYDYTNRSYNQIVLTIDGTDYDFYDAWPTNNQVNISFNVDKDHTKDITASFMMVNKTYDQSYLADTDIQITIGMVANSLTCTATEPWLYYGWGTSSTDIDTARGQHKTILRSNTGSAETTGINTLYANDNSVSVQACGLINNNWYCVDFFDPSRGNGNGSYDDYVRCNVNSWNAVCAEPDDFYESMVLSNGNVYSGACNDTDGCA
jgi:hypothetical protein